ncbi:MAG: hypothetical protein CMJ84_16350 [Planctomycetes bacterium]|nr:hypothetical protein [Planctomycetota bacterium]MDP6409985.1 Tm-1-like ATP-binding domain-containing protein [Planctomycetota bacterium]
MSVYLVATLDTKGAEAEFVRAELAAHGVEARLVDTGCLGTPQVCADVSREEVFAAAGTSLEEMVARSDRGEAVTRAAEGACRIIRKAFGCGECSGVLSLGGSAGTTIGTACMRALPLGVPKLMVSTLASGQVRQYVGDKDILMMNSVVDILGINRVSRLVLSQAARAMAGLVTLRAAEAGTGDRPLVAATMFGVTTPCVERAREVLEEAGFEVLVFHATGTGGQAMESLVREGVVSGVLDITTTELADELVGGMLSAGAARLTAAGQLGVPQVVSVGALDMVNFHARDTVPAEFDGRQFYRHNENVTLMRTTVEENRSLGEEIGRKVAAACGPSSVIIPLRGVSAIDRAGEPFDDEAARAALFEGLRGERGVELTELDLHLNDPAFAEAAAGMLIELMTNQGDDS